MKCSKCANDVVPGRKMCASCLEKNRIKCAKYRKTHFDSIKSMCKEWRDKNKDRTREYGVKYRTANVEKEKARHKKYKTENPDRVAESARKTYQKHKEKVIARQKEYRAANFEKYQEWHRAWYERNKDHYLARCREYRRNNPHIAQTYKAKRRAWERGTTVTPVDAITVFERDSWTCQICGGAIDRGAHYSHPHAPTVDHINPLCHGGAHTYDNVQCAHRVCNLRKAAKSPGLIRQTGWRITNDASQGQ